MFHFDNIWVFKSRAPVSFSRYLAKISLTWTPVSPTASQTQEKESYKRGLHVLRHVFRPTKAGSLRRCCFSKICSSAVSKGVVTPNNFSFNSSSEIWTEIHALLGYKLPNPNVKGEVQGGRLLAGVTHQAMFRAICLEVLL